MSEAKPEISGVSFQKLVKSEAKSASVYTLATFLTQFGSFLVVPFFWQKLSIIDYGIIAIVDVIASFLNMFLGLQLELSISRFYYEWSADERPQRVGTLWIISWLSTVFLGVLSLGLFSIINNFLFPDVAFLPYIFLGIIGIIIAKLSAIPYATIRIANKPMLYAVYSVLSFIVQIGLNIYFVLVLDQKLHGYLISIIIGNCVVSVIGMIIMSRFATLRIRINTLRDSLSYALPQIPASAISGITSLLDRFLLQKFASLEVMGVYSLCLKFTSLILQLHSALKISFLPFLYKTTAKDNIAGMSTLAKMRLLYILPLMIFALAISLFIKDFVHWIDRPEYFPIIFWVPWLTGPALLTSFVFYFGPGLFLAKKTNLTWIPAAIQLFFVLICGIILIPSLEITGVVIAKYASAISFFAVTFFLSQKHYPIPVKWKRIIGIMSFLLALIILSNYIYIEDLILSICFNTILVLFFCTVAIISIVGAAKVSIFISQLRK